MSVRLEYLQYSGAMGGDRSLVKLGSKIYVVETPYQKQEIDVARDNIMSFDGSFGAYAYLYIDGTVYVSGCDKEFKQEDAFKVKVNYRALATAVFGRHTVTYVDMETGLMTEYYSKEEITGGDVLGKGILAVVSGGVIRVGTKKVAHYRLDNSHKILDYGRHGEVYYEDGISVGSTRFNLGRPVKRFERIGMRYFVLVDGNVYELLYGLDDRGIGLAYCYQDYETYDFDVVEDHLVLLSWQGITFADIRDAEVQEIGHEYNATA